MCKCRDAEGAVDSDALRREVKDLQKTKTTLEAEYKQLEWDYTNNYVKAHTVYLWLLMYLGALLAEL